MAEHRLDRSGWVSTAGHLAPDDYAQPTDIVTRLRTVVATPNGVDIWTLTALEAADEIERLRAIGDRLAEQIMLLLGPLATDAEKTIVDHHQSVRRGVLAEWAALRKQQRRG